MIRGSTIDPHIDIKSDAEFMAIAEVCDPYTMTSIERMWGLYQAVRYIVANDIPGSIVECGVWKGGSMLLVAKTLMLLGDTSRDLYLMDTFDGMTEPSDVDVDVEGRPGKILFRSAYMKAGFEEVGRTMSLSGYPNSMISYAVGDVRSTAALMQKEMDASGESIAILRLDTDFYDSTLAELVHLYTLLANGGVLIVDDYGHWKGNAKAVDDYFGKRSPFMGRLDYSGRIMVKP